MQDSLVFQVGPSLKLRIVPETQPDSTSSSRAFQKLEADSGKR